MTMTAMKQSGQQLDNGWIEVCDTEPFGTKVSALDDEAVNKNRQRAVSQRGWQ